MDETMYNKILNDLRAKEATADELATAPNVSDVEHRYYRGKSCAYNDAIILLLEAEAAIVNSAAAWEKTKERHFTPGPGW